MPRIKTAESIRRRGNTICPIDETIPARVVVRDCINKTYRVRRSSVVVEDPAPVEVAAEIVTDETTDAEYAAAAFEALTDSTKHATWDNLSLTTRREFVEILVRTRVWQRLNVGQKAHATSSGVMVWKVNPDNSFSWACRSVNTGRWHTVTFDPNSTIDRLRCDCEAGLGRTDCYHMRRFCADKLPSIMDQYHAGCVRLLNAVGVDRVAELDHRQEHAEAEAREVGFISCRSNDYNRGRIAERSASLINPKGDF